MIKVPKAAGCRAQGQSMVVVTVERNQKVRQRGGRVGTLWLRWVGWRKHETRDGSGARCQVDTNDFHSPYKVEGGGRLNCDGGVTPVRVRHLPDMGFCMATVAHEVVLVDGI